MPVPRGLPAKARKRQSAQRRDTTTLARQVSARARKGRATVAFARTELRLLALRSYRGWVRAIGGSTKLRSDAPEPTNADIDRILNTGWGPGALTFAERIKRRRSPVATVVGTEADRLNNLMRDRATRDVVADTNRELAGWRYTTQMDQLVRPLHKKAEGRVFPVGKKRIRLPRAPRCRCYYLPVLKAKRKRPVR